MNKMMIARTLLYFTYGFLPIIVGLDKFFSILTQWAEYLHVAIPSVFGVSAIVALKAVGILEILAGFLVLYRPKIGGCVVAAWLICIALNFLSMHMYYDIAARDVALAVGAIVLVLLS